MQHLQRGGHGEAIAALYLELQGFEILARNVRSATVQVDLVARQAQCLVLVEVKLRCDGLQSPSQALGKLQHLRLRRGAAGLLSQHAWAEEVRLDVVGVHVHRLGLSVEHLRGIRT